MTFTFEIDPGRFIPGEEDTVHVLISSSTGEQCVYWSNHVEILPRFLVDSFSDFIRPIRVRRRLLSEIASLRMSRIEESLESTDERLSRLEDSLVSVNE